MRIRKTVATGVVVMTSAWRIATGLLVRCYTADSSSSSPVVVTCSGRYKLQHSVGDNRVAGTRRVRRKLEELMDEWILVVAKTMKRSMGWESVLGKSHSRWNCLVLELHLEE